MRRSRRPVTLVVLAAAAAAACGEPEGSGEAGMGLPRQVDGETYPGNRVPVSGRMVVADNGCFHLDVDDNRRFVIWPAEAEHDGDGVLLPDGSRSDGGTALEGFGALMPADALGGGPDGYWAAWLGFCAPEDSQVLVLDEVRVARSGS